MSAAPHARLFAQARELFDLACERCGGAREHALELGGFSVRVRFAGPALEQQLMPSLAHRVVGLTAAAGSVGADLTIQAWDSASTATPFPAGRWYGELPGPPRGLRFLERDGLRALFNPNTRALSLLDDDGAPAVYWVEAAGEVPAHERAAPFRTLLQWWMAGHGRLLAHAAAVGRAGRGVVIAGGERAGKSTTAWLCLRHGLEIAGDDHVILAEHPPDRVFSLYSSLKLDPGWPPGDGRAPLRGDGPAHSASEKIVSFLMPEFASRLPGSFALEAILLPRITGGRASAIRPASPADGMRTLAPTTVYLHAGARAETFRMLAGIVRRVPCHILDLGGDLEAIPGVIERFLEAA